MFIRYFSRIKLMALKVLGADWQGKLNRLEKNISKVASQSTHKPLRVLIGPSFAINPPSYALDRCLSLALRMKGADIIPIYCDGIQQIECNFFGGEWGGKHNFHKNCKNCKNTSERLWQLSIKKAIPLSRYLSNDDIDKIKTIVLPLDFTDALKYEANGIEYGKLAKDILVNNYLVATPTLIKNHESLIKTHLQNLLLVGLSYENILADQKPDRVISNDSYYGMWAVLEQLCKARSIPFYSHWPATRNRVAFAHNDAAMNLNFSSSWPSFLMNTLSVSDENRIDNWLTGERGYIIDTTKLNGHEKHEPILNTIDPVKPTLILAANVIWDLAALNKQIIFNDMGEWIISTIDWFRNHPEFQLIIRPHPAETAPQIPRTRETIALIIELSGIQLPINVFLLKSNAKVTLNELITKYKVKGISVHTTTVGFECPAQGIPVITTGKSAYRGFGFTVDPTSKEEYFFNLMELLVGETHSVTDTKRELARKFIKFYQFHYYSDIGIFSNVPPEISNSFMEILENENSAFSHVINAIIGGLPINSPDNWLPES